MIIGIVGSIASGKDTVADYLKTKGFAALSLSDTLRKLMRQDGAEITTSNMTEYGNNLRNTKGYDYLAKEASKEIKSNEDVIVTSIRQVGEVEYFKQMANFTLVKLDAPIELRLDRLIKRGREGDIKNLTELQEIEAKQADGKGGGMNMNRCYQLADEEIINDGTFDELYQKVDDLVLNLRSKDQL
ncbi:MAG: hypothetical protein BWY68_00028 [bacterium ADurb.Bin400]|nr:MAG: hypothetical protein BWY68_00028 [bacterium ADurb.Bin400]